MLGSNWRQLVLLNTWGKHLVGKQQFKLLWQILKLPQVSRKASDLLIFPCLCCPVPGNVSVSYIFSVCHGKTWARNYQFLGQPECMTFVFLFLHAGNVKCDIKYSKFGSSDQQSQCRILNCAKSKTKAYPLERAFLQSRKTKLNTDSVTNEMKEQRRVLYYTLVFCRLFQYISPRISVMSPGP